MDAEHFQKVKDIFAKAADFPADKRTAILREKCGADEELFAEVNSLLAAHDDAENLIEKNAFDYNSVTKTKSNNYDGRIFGHYKIIREIGHGGMGAVFLAERNDGEFDQQVALKIVRQTIVSAELERHFRRERQILASLNHPNIAKLLDGGVSENGEPFLAMEYVEGKTLLEFAVDLSIEEKLKLFLKICNAVAYAHQNLVVHHDIKPSNIIVTKDGEPKLLDFGLAKIQDESFTNDSTQTVFRALTPAYASPEQLRGKSVTTVSDVYSLGVVFYELLSGDKPFHFEGKSLEEILQTITHDEAIPPSAVTNPKSQIPNSKLNSDLDNIALKALQKETESRYRSVEEFANDIERHLKGLPILARPATFSYRAAKFIRRNKILVSAAIFVLLSFIFGGAISFIQFREAQNERAKSDEVRTFLQKMLLTANPEGSKGFSASMNEMLEQAANRLETEDFSKQPEVKAELHTLLGNIYLVQGQYEKSEKYLNLAIKEQVELYGEDNHEVILNKFRIANLNVARANYDEAESFYKQYLPILREQYQRGELEIITFLRVLNDYALTRRARGDSHQSELLFRENLELSMKTDANRTSQNYLRTMIALTVFDQGKFEEAESETQNLLAELKRASADELDTGIANALTLLGSIQTEKGDLKAAAANLLEGEKLYRKYYSPNFIQIFDNLRLQAQVSYLTGNYRQAEIQIAQVLENYRHNSNPKYISYATALTLQGLISNKLGRTNEAENILREAVRLREQNLPPKHFLTALTKNALGEVLTANRKFDEAEKYLIESRDELKELQAAENGRITTAEIRLAELYRVWNKSDR